ncbi:caspase family protein [Variovorax sp. J22R24]|uniref:caspase family protein n=1 Tax=Variovorax gracilis TaxID=3053502 RepID=UPI0025789AC8|nr:caspase family protein [Variovorax sp. J22R24]MDM0109843.1 caspase family protein [Variovorax sp. J22R24]
MQIEALPGHFSAGLKWFIWKTAWAVLLLLFSSATLAAGIEQEFRSKPNVASTLEKLAGTRSKSYAVLIGITEYSEFPSLSEAKNDVDRMRLFLIEAAGFDHVFVLTEEFATKSRIESLMVDKIPTLLGPEDKFVFYWSGHGTARKLANGRLHGYMPLASSQKNAFGGMVSMDDLTRWDDLLSAKQALFILDTCVSGLAGVQAKSDRTLTLAQLDQPSHHLFAAGTSTEQTIVGAKWKGSLFTDAFIRAATGAAGDGASIISLSDILVFVRREVALQKDKEGWTRTITPQLRQLRTSDGEFFFVRRAQTVGTSNPTSSGEKVSGKGENLEPRSHSTEIAPVPPIMWEAKNSEPPSVAPPPSSTRPIESAVSVNPSKPPSHASLIPWSWHTNETELCQTLSGGEPFSASAGTCTRQTTTRMRVKP